MKAIFIDVTAQTVTDIDLQPGLKTMYDVIGCQCVDRRTIDSENDLWFDDEGLLLDPQPPKFRFGIYPHLFAGNALICGYTEEGETIGTNFLAEQIRPFIQFLGYVRVEPQPSIFIDWVGL